ncbi:MAG: dihydropteroate synthase [Armatimonadetes bacterium]|nr:dihydropteroate synthase [Armatimonadota bacterium]
MKLASQEIAFGQRTLVMGIVNVTPDSFSGDGTGGDVARAVAQGRAMVADGADWLDIGGESTRPGAVAISRQEEINRVCPVVAALAREVPAPLSVDTRWAEVASAALSAGAHLVNDVSGLTNDPALAGVVARAGVPVVLQHMRGTPDTMQSLAHYEDVVEQVRTALAGCLAAAVSAGIERGQCLVDPGIGFAKLTPHNLELLRRLGELRELGAPILIGVSRKRFIGEVLGVEANDRLEGTAAAVALAIAGGADVVRVHDVRAMARVARMSDAIVRGWAP